MLTSNKQLYLIKSLETGYYKIGISTRPEKRILQLQTGSSGELIIIHKYTSEYASKIERTLHRLYSHYHVKGEWFDLSINEEVNFINQCKMIEKGLILLNNRDNNLF